MHETSARSNADVSPFAGDSFLRRVLPRPSTIFAVTVVAVKDPRTSTALSSRSGG